MRHGGATGDDEDAGGRDGGGDPRSSAADFGGVLMAMKSVPQVEAAASAGTTESRLRVPDRSQPAAPAWSAGHWASALAMLPGMSLTQSRWTSLFTFR